jgi:hypothetical protein
MSTVAAVAKVAGSEAGVEKRIDASTQLLVPVCRNADFDHLHALAAETRIDG